MSETRLVGVQLKDGPGVMMRVPIETKSAKPVAYKPPPVPRAVDQVAKKRGLSKDIGRLLFIFGYHGKEWLKPRKFGETSQLWTLQIYKLVRTAGCGRLIREWSDGITREELYYIPGVSVLTELGTTIYVEMREAIAEGVT